MTVIEVVTSSVEETVALGRAIGCSIQPGDLLLLTGEVGAGKTAFVRGLAHAMNLDDDVTSPTFALMHVYDRGAGSRPLVHADLYRIESEGELRDLALDEYLDDGAVVVVEWGEGLLNSTSDYGVVSLELTGTSSRRVTVSLVGDAWRSRRTAIEEALAS